MRILHPISLLLLGSCAVFERNPQPPAEVPVPEIISTAEWGSRPDPIPLSRRHTPERITIHHSGVAWKPTDDPYVKIVALQTWGREAKGWPDVPYHYLISPDGRIFEGRPLRWEGETNTEYDVAGHALVHLWGNFEIQRVTQAQLESAVRLVAWLCRAWNIRPATIAGHKDWSGQTLCPGKDLYRYVADGRFRKWVEETLAGRTPRVRLQ